MKTPRTYLTLLAAFAFALTPPALAGPRTGGSTTTTTTSSSSSSRSSAPSTAPSTRSTAPTTWGKSTTTNKAAPASVNSADKAMAAKSQATGVSTQSRSQAFSAPVASSNGVYTSSSSAGTRQYYRDPDSGRFVPQTVIVNNNPMPLSWYGGGGGYGYWNGPLWVAYNDSMPVYTTPVAYHHVSFGHAMLDLLWFLIVLAVLAALVFGVYWFFFREEESVARVPSGGGYGSRYSKSYPSPSNTGGGGESPTRDAVPDEPTPGFDPHVSSDWDKVTPGSIITLSDPISGALGKQHTVSTVATVAERNGLGKWLFFNFEDDFNLRLMAKIVDDNVGLRLLERTDDPKPMTRRALIENGYAMLFVKPEDENNFDPVKLRYTKEIPDWDSNDKQYTTTFVMKDQGEMHGHQTINPPLSGVGTLKTTVIEYAAAPQRGDENPAGSEKPDPLRNNLILIESGELVEYFLAGPVKISEASVEHKSA